MRKPKVQVPPNVGWDGGAHEMDASMDMGPMRFTKGPMAKKAAPKAAPKKAASKAKGRSKK